MSVKADKISELTISRLSVYLRCLNELWDEGTHTTSSQGLADRFNLNSAQIRKDLAYFGEFGVRGLGYNIEELRNHLVKILGLDRPHRIGVIGAGNLGNALAKYDGFSPSNFSVVALFDTDPGKIGRRLASGVEVHSMEEFARVASRFAIDIVAIAVPARVADAALDEAVRAGIKAVLNFAPIRLSGRPGVKVKQVDLLVSLEGLSHFLANRPLLAHAGVDSVLPDDEYPSSEA
jgi:redox-sensing transcriptional repressor